MLSFIPTGSSCTISIHHSHSAFLPATATIGNTCCIRPVPQSSYTKSTIFHMTRMNLKDPLVVVALGGNALLKRGEDLTDQNQAKNAQIAAKSLADIVRAGYRLCITHGNGPQVGILALLQNSSLDVLGAETEGSIGYLLELALENELKDSRHSICTLLTQTVVDLNDPAFQNPTKPVGRRYTKEEADKVVADLGFAIAPDGKDMWRRVVPSPLPRDIVELKAIQILVQNEVVVICTGGGGIPIVVSEQGTKVGVEAVVDKDYASALLAQKINADAFLMLTDAEGVYDPDQYEKGNKVVMNCLFPGQISASKFPPGSMAPKIQAAYNFARSTGNIAGIGSLEDALKMLQGQGGTIISNEPVKVKQPRVASSSAAQ